MYYQVMSERVLISREKAKLTKPMQSVVSKMYGSSLLNDISVEQIRYLSDSLEINGYLAMPSTITKPLPLLIWNRGGYKNDGGLDDLLAYLILASTAVWGYIVLATQYRGNMGSEGKEDWGGNDVRDSLNLLSVAEELPECDLNCVAIEGASRGGMTTYRALAQDDRFKCAIVHAGLSDLFALEEARSGFTEFLDKMFGHLTIDERRTALASRSGVYLAERFPSDCPILLIHGLSDTTVPHSQSEAMAKELVRLKRPHELVLLDNAGHIALKDKSYKRIDPLRKKWLEKWLHNR